MSAAYEVRMNIALARLLRRLGFIEIAERFVKRERADLILFHKGLRIAFEGSYSGIDAQRDAEERLESGLSDICFAVWYEKDLFPQYLDEMGLEQRLERAKLKVKILAPGEDVTNTLLPFLMKVTKLPAEPVVEGWLIVDVAMLKQCVEYAVQHAASESRIQQLQVEVGNFVQDFTNALASIDRKATICKDLYDTFYRLYGLSVGDYKEIRDLIYGKTALAILLSSVFYECVAGKHGLRSSRALVLSEGSARSALTTAFEKIRKINYQPVFSVAYESLSKLPPETEAMLKSVIELASKIADNRALLRRDFAGKIYHAIVGDWVVRKGFATYFTSVPAAYLLSSLALLTPNPDWREKEWSDLDCLKDFRICDFAEGTGTLLSASCDALEYLYIKNALTKGKEIDIEKFHRTLMENVVWGHDALRYAVHIAATTLALRNPDVTLSNMNLYAVPLGVNSEGRVSLGSLEFLGKGIPTTMLGYLEGQKGAIMTKISAAEEVEVGSMPQKFDYITMNPPFTRATGRGAKREEARRGLFGFMTDAKLRKNVLDRYKSIRNSIRKQLTEIADHSGMLSKISPSKNKEEIRPFLSIGQAGEGLLFLHLAYELVESGGRIAFVLPRNLLSGSSWFLARSLLASRFHVEYIIVSFDPQRGYNFSESTALSEVLLVARRAVGNPKNEKTCVVCLLKKPDTAISATQLAHEIAKRYSEQLYELNIFEHGYGAQNIVETGVIVYTVPRQLLLENVDNWGKLVAFTDPWLTMKTLEVLNGIVDIGNVKVKLPLKRLGELSDIGIDAHQFHDNFEKVADKTPGAYRTLYGGGEEIRSQILNEPNACIMPKTRASGLLFKRFSSCLLIPDRIWFDTAHVISIYASEPVLSNIFYSIKLKAKDKWLEKSAKALCLWFNTTWGLLSVLASREETRGRWMRLKMSHWRLLPVLDVLSLSHEQLDKFEELFRKCENVNWRRLMEQYGGLIPQPERLRLDTELIKIIKPNINTEEVETFLQNELYPRLYQALKSWIGTWMENY